MSFLMSFLMYFQTNLRFLTLNIIAGLIFIPQLAHARIEYALSKHITSCTACHASPFGGGPRYVEGKLFGSRNDTPSEWSYQDKLSADVRGIAYYPEGGTTSRQGTSLMTTSLGLNIPISKKADQSELRFVSVYGLGMVQQGARDIYAQWLSAPRSHSPYIWQFGRFNAPFGLMSDEHRTYTKLLTRTEIFDYEYGVSLSGEFNTNFHYDLAITNGLVSGGQFNNNSTATPDSTSALFANVRWMPATLPLLFGFSASEHQRLSQYKNPMALSLYTALSLDRLTNNSVSGSVQIERVYGENWSDPLINPNVNRYFVPATNTSYLATILDEPAEAWMALVNLNIGDRWVAQYKYDRLTFAPKYSGDYFDRNGLGFKYFPDSNLVIWSRYEWATVGRPELKDSNLVANQNAFWLMLQLWL